MIANNYRPKEAMISCAKENHVDYEAIHKCFDSPHGAELLKIHGEATGALRPRVSYSIFFLFIYYRLGHSIYSDNFSIRSVINRCDN